MPDWSPSIELPLLVVEDEPVGRRLLMDYLDRCGFQSNAAGSIAEAQRLRAEQRYALILLDLSLPDGDGLAFLNDLRAGGSDVPVIVISAQGDEEDRIRGLLSGADDYLAKPASPREVVARVMSVLRRSNPTVTERLCFGDLEIDPVNRRAKRGEAELDLAPKEFEILALMARNPNRAFSRSELLEQAWGSSPEWQDPGTVTVHIRRLRTKIEDDPANPTRLVTVYGHGYRFVP